MRLSLLILTLILLTACSTDPTPAMCRDVGVAVPDGAEITGTIVEKNIGTLDEVSRMCRSPWHLNAGCALPVAPGRYVLWMVEDETVIRHEYCHALYEERRHTKRL